MKYNLLAIFEKIVEESLRDEDAGFTIKELWKWVVFDSNNTYLNDSLTIHDPSGIAIRGRETEIDKNILIEGDFLLFDYIDHAPIYSLKVVKTRQDLVNLVLSDSGILNVFTTTQIPIVKGEVRSLQKAIEVIDTSGLEASLLNQELVNDFQKILDTPINTTTFSSALQKARNCIILYKAKGMSQQNAYDLLLVVKLVYVALEINYVDDFIDEVLDCICGFMGNKQLWIWDRPL